MKILLVAEKETTRDALVGFLQPQGFDFIHYHSPIKAMDNIDEIEPDIVLFSAEDFPRHWKPFVGLLRAGRTEMETAFVLLSGPSFSFDEAAKATHLQVSAVVSERPEERKELQKLEAVIARFSVVKDDRSNFRYFPSESDAIEFLFTHPATYGLVTGVLIDLSPSGASFSPDDPKITADIPAGSVIPHCSLKIGSRYFEITCRVIRNSTRMALKFIRTPEEVEVSIIDYIDRHAERELMTLLKDKN